MRSFKFGENIIGAISVGAVFVIIGIVYVLALPNSLWDRTISFFSSLTSRTFPGTGISLPAPIVPGAHIVFYQALFQFCLGLAILQIVVLMLRLMWRSPIRKTAETVGNLAFWFGASFLTNTFLNRLTTVNTWFAFWAGILMMVGVSLIVRALVLMLRR
jgi:hypothetical protein